MRKLLSKIVPVVGAAALPVLAMAFDEPNTGDLAYEIYDIAVNKMLQGPLGFVSGVGLISFGIVSGVMGKGSLSTSVLSVLGGGALASAEGITTTLGAQM